MNKKKNSILIIAIIIIILTIIGIVAIINNNKYKYKILEISDDKIQYYKLEQNGKYGVIDKDGNVIIEPKYKSIDIPNPTKAVFIKSEDGKNYNAVDNNNSNILTQYQNVEAISINNISSNIPYEKTVLKYKQDGLYGLITLDGKKITENRYDSINNIDYKEGNLKVEENGKYGVINIKGTKIIETEYDSIMSDGYYDDKTKYENAGFVLRVKTDDGYRFGYANKKGKIILETLYNEVNRITEIEGNDIYIITSNNGRYGVIKNGKEILKNEYTEITFDQNNNLLIVEKEQAYGVVNLEGKNVIPIDYDNIIIGGRYIDALKEDNLIIFDSKGTKLDTDIISYNPVTDNYAIVIGKDNTYNIVDKNGKNKLGKDYTYIEYFKEDKFIATKDGKTGIIDGEGKVIIELKYSAIQKIEGTDVLQAINSSNERTDIIDEEMKIHEGIENAHVAKKETYIKVYSEKDVKYYNLKGKETTYKDIYPNNKIYAEKKDGKWGLLNSKGETVVNYEYDMVTEQNGNVAGVKKDGKWQVVNIEGKLLSQNKYEIEWLDVSFLGNYYRSNNQVGNITYSGTM